MNWFKIEPLLFVSMFLLMVGHLFFDVPLISVMVGEMILFILVGVAQLMQSRALHAQMEQDMQKFKTLERKQIRKKKEAKVNEDLYSLLKKTL